MLESWRDTPYVPGQRARGEAVDCVRFVTGVLDDLYGVARVSIARLPQDTALHSPKTARAAMREILRIYEPNVAVLGGEVEPGDIVVTGPANGGPGHAIIAGARPGELWEADRPCVRQIGLSTTWRIYAVYRVLDKDRWLRGAA